MTQHQNKPTTIQSRGPAFDALLSELDDLVRQTFLLWDEVRVGFSWRHYYYNHTDRVRNLGVQLCRLENADPELCALAATLHDITKRYDGEIIVDNQGKRIVDENGFWKCKPNLPARQNEVTRIYDRLGLYGQMHHFSGAAVARKLLGARGVDRQYAAAVGEIISAHVRGNGNLKDGISNRAECRILYDADLMDANLGLVAFFRNIGIHVHRHFEKTDNLDLAEYLDYLPSWIDMKHDFIGKLLTASGRRIGIARHERKVQLWEKIRQERSYWVQSRQYGLLGVIEYLMAFHEDPDLTRELQSLRDEWLPEREERLRSQNGDIDQQARLELAREFVQLLEAEVLGKT